MKISSLTGTIADKLGMTSIATTVGITTAKQAEVIEQSLSWGMTDYALAVSMIGGTLFAIEKILIIYEKIKQRKEDKAEDK